MAPAWNFVNIFWKDRLGWTFQEVKMLKAKEKLFYIPGRVYAEGECRVLILQNFGEDDEGHEMCVILDERGVALVGFFPNWRDLVE